ncbi:MAG: succinate dehydrogenase assembly factor 2 [Gammaproteobacteria bacterium]|nr:succinate dehydrogenase assembly factor 2 [Gammaproteobacteria bacterium]
METTIKQLRWKCRRGMKELDTLLLNYLEDCYPRAENKHQQAFLKILDMHDPELWSLLVGRLNSRDKDINDVVTALQHST